MTKNPEYFLFLQVAAKRQALECHRLALPLDLWLCQRVLVQLNGLEALPADGLGLFQDGLSMHGAEPAKKNAATIRAQAAMEEAQTIWRQGFATISEYNEKLAKLQRKRKEVALR